MARIQSANNVISELKKHQGGGRKPPSFIKQKDVFKIFLLVK